jgi:hypothetical protein
MHGMSNIKKDTIEMHVVTELSAHMATVTNFVVTLPLLETNETDFFSFL